MKVAAFTAIFKRGAAESFIDVHCEENQLFIRYYYMRAHTAVAKIQRCRCRGHKLT